MKRRVLVVDDSDDIRELIAFILESSLNVEVHQENSGKNAVSTLSKDKNFHLILSDLNMPGGGGIEIFKFLKEKKVGIPMVIISSDKVDNHPDLKGLDDSCWVPKPFTDQQLLTIVRNHLRFSTTAPDPSADAGVYIPVNLGLLTRVFDVKTPLYVKINDHKFVRVTHEQFNFDDQAIKKYQGKQVTHLYIERDHIHDFISEFKKKALSDLAWEAAGDKATANHIKLNTELLRELAIRLGWNEEIIDLAKSHAQRALAVAASNPDLHQILNQFHRIEHFGFADHCTLLLMVSAGLAFKLGMADDLNLRRLTFASLFHDMSLSDEQYQNKNKLLKAIQKRQAKTSDIKDVLSHPARAAELCRKWDYCPAAVDTIIFQHHEAPDGSGFPMGRKPSEMHPLSCLFIICEDFVNYFVEFGTKADFSSFIESRTSVYTEGDYFKSFKNLSELLNADVQTAS